MTTAQCLLVYLLIGVSTGCWDAYWLTKGMHVTDPNGAKNEKMKSAIIWLTFIITVLFWPILLLLKLLTMLFPARK